MSLCTAAFGMWLGGCAQRMPEVRKDLFAQRMPAIPQGAAPLYSWHGSRTDLKTYWGDQQVVVQAAAHFPEGWKNPGDERWQVTARNGQGRRIQFIGVERKYLNENGTELAVLVPPLDLSMAPDSLYLVIVPNVSLSDGRIVSIRPVAVLCEIRGHAFKPFRVKIPLAPEQQSPLTPPPEPLPETPAGTPIPFE